MVVARDVNGCLEVTNRAWVAETLPWDDHLAPDGRVMEMLSEHQCQGWLEGYLLTGRDGFFSCYQAFIRSSYELAVKEENRSKKAS